MHTGILQVKSFNMTSILELKDQIINFWDIEGDEKREAFIKKLERIAKSSNEDEFITCVRENFEQINFSGISVIYEAVSSDPMKWSNFFYQEYERAFKSATVSETPFKILECLEEIGFTDATKFTRRTDLVELLKSYINHAQAATRFKAIYYLGDWIASDNIDRHSDVIKLMTEQLNDRNWKVRRITKLTLIDLDRLPPNYQESFIDKIRSKLFNTFDMK